MLKSWQKETIGYMCANMHHTLATTLSDCFAKFDKDRDGKLTYKDFMDAIASLRMYLSLPSLSPLISICVNTTFLSFPLGKRDRSLPSTRFYVLSI